MKDRWSGRKENSSFLPPQGCLNIQCNEKVNHCPPAGVSVSRALLTGLKQRGDTWHFLPCGHQWRSLRLNRVPRASAISSAQDRPADRWWPQVCASTPVTLMVEQNHIPTGSRRVSDTVILPADSQTQITGGIDWLQWRPVPLIHMENNRGFECQHTCRLLRFTNWSFDSFAREKKGVIKRLYFKNLYS